jgi:hypothetical protein
MPEGKGAILYMNQEGRGIGLLNKLKALSATGTGNGYCGGKPSSWFFKWIREITVSAHKYCGILVLPDLG